MSYWHIQFRLLKEFDTEWVKTVKLKSQIFNHNKKFLVSGVTIWKHATVWKHAAWEICPNIYVSAATHSKFVNNYAKEGNSRQFRLPKELLSAENDGGGEAVPFVAERGDERKPEWNWLVTNAVRHGWSRNVLAPFSCLYRDAIHGKRGIRRRIDVSPRRVYTTSSTRARTPQPL